VSNIKSIGCRDKFHHIVKQNVIGSVRIACLCLSLLASTTIISASIRVALNILDFRCLYLRC